MGAEFGGTNHGSLGGGIVPFGSERERNEGAREGCWIAFGSFSGLNVERARTVS